MRSVRSVSATRVPSVASEASSVTVDMVESGSGERGMEPIASWGERARMSNWCLETLGGGLGPGEAAPLGIILSLTTGEWDWRFSGLSHSSSDRWELYGKCVSCKDQRNLDKRMTYFTKHQSNVCNTWIWSLSPSIALE